jgi:hypothetical protein
LIYERWQLENRIPFDWEDGPEEILDKMQKEFIVWWDDDSMESNVYLRSPLLALLLKWWESR